MPDHLVNQSHTVETMIGFTGIGIGAVHWLEVAQNVIVSVGSIAGAVLVIWTLIDKIRLRFKKSQRATDKVK